MDFLIDSNSYLRIAKTINPLLGQPFGPDRYKLLIHSFCDAEIDKCSRLKSKFTWVNESCFINNRKKSHIKIANHLGNEIIRIASHINTYKRISFRSISDADIISLSTARVLDINLITDDPGLLAAACEFEIKFLKTIEFLNYLCTNKIINDAKLLEVYECSEYHIDHLKVYRSDHKNHFPHL